MSALLPPPVGPDWKVWARQLSTYLSRALPSLNFKTGGETAATNGILLWDDVNLSPVVSRSGGWAAISALGNAVYVSHPSQITGVIDSTKIYIIDGIIDVGSSTIDVPEGGMFILGLGFGVSKIKTTAAGTTLFTGSGAYSGDLFTYDVDIEVSGAGSSVFNLDNAGNFSAVECVNTNFTNCQSLGNLSNYRQGLWSNVALLFCVDGLTMTGTWAGGFRATTAIIIGPTFSGTIFKAGAGLVISGRFISDLNALSIQSGAAFCDFAPANITNDAAFLITNVGVNNASTAFPNMPVGSTKARFSRCSGAPNTYVGAQWAITTAAATTTVAATPVKLAGVTTYTDEQWFGNTTDNAFVYGGTEGISVSVQASLALSGTNGHKINTIIRKYDAALASYSDLATSGPQTMDAGNKVESVAIHGFGTLALNDRIEIWIENDSAGTVTAELDGIVSVSERPS